MALCQEGLHWREEPDRAVVLVQHYLPYIYRTVGPDGETGPFNKWYRHK